MENLLLEAVTKSQQILGDYVRPDSDKDAEQTINELLGVLDDENLVGKIHEEHGQTIFWPTSGNVERTKYIASDKLLEVEFLNGGVYQYKDVPKEVWDKIKTAQSIGSFMQRNIKGNYRYEKIS